MKSFFALFLLAVFLYPAHAADTETAPEGINVHYTWCAKPKTAAEKLKRYEGFWKQRLPADGEYDDQTQIAFVRKCAYRLAELYAQTGDKEKCQKMLKWLEKTDDALPENSKDAK